MAEAGPPAASPAPAPAEGSPTLAELGEWELIERLGSFAPAGQFQDDAALLQPEGTLVVNTDVLVEDVHFSEATTGPFAVGWRAAAANLSDLAAMGCSEATGLTVGLVAPPSTPWSWVEQVYAGLRACLEPTGGHLLGGDCSSGRQRLLAITALGPLPTAPDGAPLAVRRGDGRPGDLLVSTGPHGLSRLGLALLLGELTHEQRACLPVELVARAIEAHHSPRPRFDAIRRLRHCRPQGSPWRVGGTDSSDGLAAAAEAIARASDCRALLERATLPLDPAMAPLPEAESWCLGGGEDFELVLALEPAWAEALLGALPGSRRIGELAPAAPLLPSVGWLGENPSLAPSSRGFEHFQKPAAS
ncbi:MAG: thiamine-phosphate kinase [Prochlorococcaceae cyanobacterium]|jgi:thiamine-monophosphate kinase